MRVAGLFRRANSGGLRNRWDWQGVRGCKRLPVQQPSRTEMPSYTRLTRQQRYTIEVMNRNRSPQKEIAAAIGVSASTVSRELVRDGMTRDNYCYVAAHLRQVKARMPDSIGYFQVRLSRSMCLGSGSNAARSARSQALTRRTVRRS